MATGHKGPQGLRINGVKFVVTRTQPDPLVVYGKVVALRLELRLGFGVRVRVPVDLGLGLGWGSAWSRWPFFVWLSDDATSSTLGVGQG